MLKDIKHYNFNRIYEILQSGFPSDEYRSYEGQKKLLSHPEYKILGELDSADQLKGFLAVFELPELRFIEHFVVVDKYRNTGLGKRLLREFCSLCDKPVVLEVELPCSRINQRRIAFYERNGFHYNSYEYVQPVLDVGKKPIPLSLMTYPAALKNSPEFELYKESLYKHVYGL